MVEEFEPEDIPVCVLLLVDRLLVDAPALDATVVIIELVDEPAREDVSTVDVTIEDVDLIELVETEPVLYTDIRMAASIPVSLKVE